MIVKILESIIKDFDKIELTEKRWGVDHYLTNKQFIEKIKEKYSGELNDIYVHFSNDFVDSKEQLINTIGLNMKQNYGNPFGIYAYPIDRIADFKSDAKGCYILRNKRNERYIDDIYNMGQIEYMRCIDILKERYFNDEKTFIDFLKETERLSRKKSDGAFLFYFIVRLSERQNKRKLSVVQSEIWRKDLGYTMIGDRGNEIIHPSEPAQALWFSTKDFEIVDMNFDRKEPLLDESKKQYNSDGTWIYNGNIDCSKKQLKNLYLMKGCTRIEGHFYCSSNPNLTSLQGLENLKTVGGYFYCSHNQLENFKGLENLKTVGEYFFCSSNPNLTSLQGLENLKTVGGDFYCSSNPNLTSLQGLETLTTIRDGFYCTHNQLENFKGLENLKTVGGDFYYSCNPNLHQNEIDRFKKQIGKLK